MDMMAIRRILITLVGSGGNNLIVKKGSFKLSERTSAQDVIINHGLGVVPQIVIINAPDYESENIGQNADVVYGIYCGVNSSKAPFGAFMSAGYYSSSTATSISYAAMNNTTGRTYFENALSSTQFCGITYNNSFRYASNVTYDWIAIAGIDG